MREALEAGAISRGALITEGTAGSTGVSLAMVGRVNLSVNVGLNISVNVRQQQAGLLTSGCTAAPPTLAPPTHTGGGRLRMPLLHRDARRRGD